MTVHLQFSDKARDDAYAQHGITVGAHSYLKAPDTLTESERRALVAVTHASTSMSCDRESTIAPDIYPATDGDWPAMIQDLAAKREAATEAEFAARMERASTVNDAMQAFADDERSHIDTLRRHRRELSPLLPSMPQEETELLPAYPAYLARCERDREEYEQYLADAKAREERENAEREARVKALADEQAAWIAAHGSEHLRNATAAGYDCLRTYSQERLALEYPGFRAGYADGAEWQSKNNPSPGALADALKYGGKVVWLKSGGPWDEHDPEDYDEDGQWEPCEAVLVRDFIGRYDILKV